MGAELWTLGGDCSREVSAGVWESTGGRAEERTSFGRVGWEQACRSGGQGGCGGSLPSTDSQVGARLPAPSPGHPPAKLEWAPQTHHASPFLAVIHWRQSPPPSPHRSLPKPFALLLPDPNLRPQPNHPNLISPR